VEESEVISGELIFVVAMNWINLAYPQSEAERDKPHQRSAERHASPDEEKQNQNLTNITLCN
jgi:hypothetical protein